MLSVFSSLHASLIGLCTATYTGTSENALLNHVAGLWERGLESFSNVARLVLGEFSEPRRNVSFCDVDVILLGHSGRAMAHETGQRKAVHAGLCCAGSERVSPAVIRKALDARPFDCPLMRVLEGNNVARLSAAGKDIRR